MQGSFAWTRRRRFQYVCVVFDTFAGAWNFCVQAGLRHGVGAGLVVKAALRRAARFCGVSAPVPKRYSRYSVCQCSPSGVAAAVES